MQRWKIENVVDYKPFISKTNKKINGETMHISVN